MSNLKINFSYEPKRFQGIFKKILILQRNKFFKFFKNEIFFDKNSQILDIGAANVDNDYDNNFIDNFPYKKNLTCLSDQKLDILKGKYPEITIIEGDGRKMKFKSKSFDIVFSNAVLEHVGSKYNQISFLKECIRVSRKNIFIITPYRYFPIEMHTKIPLLHFLPIKIFRKILQLFGEKFLSNEANLNLLTKTDLKNICIALDLENYEIKFSYFLGFRSNLILKVVL
jgi:ubiquinone/menaquinone biosynthesis C-methylase UbiE|tara:strand:+ start:813 stop:1493 length:681 start_codon:yes stop_codon:yes gene_type:complete